MVRDREKRRIEEPIGSTSPGWTETMMEVAVLPSLDCASGLGYLAVTCVHVPVTVHRSGQCRISYV